MEISQDKNKAKARLKIALGDLRHKSAGKHSCFMPLGIGFIASYALAQLDNADNAQFRLYADPDKMLKEIKEWQPDVIGLANYCWNSELAKLVFKQAKKINSKLICVAGGPNFPTEHQECQQYLLDNPEIDLYVYFEGERAFADLIKKILAGTELNQLKDEPQKGVMSIHSEKNCLVAGPSMPRIIDMDEIPSPYLTGLMDKWFDGSYAPCIETARGCPFSCGYCFVGSQRYYDRLASFSVERVKQDLTYIAKRISKYPDVFLAISDSNFGVYQRDEEIAKHISKLQNEFNWPNVFDVNTGKINYGRILRIAALLKNRMPITSSVQSLNPKTLDVIKRKNLSIDEYKKLNAEIKKQGMRSLTEMIAPMPEETKESFFNGLKIVSNIIGVDRVTSYTTMLLQGTYLASKKYREKYKYKTKFRILPRQFGEYGGEKCFEIEEVCIATKTMSFDDYLEIRGFSLVSSFFMDNQFDIVHQHLKELGISNYDYFYKLWQKIKTENTPLSAIYNQFIEETQKELWDSPEALYAYFQEQDNYKQLLKGELGDNLMRKYRVKIFFSECAPVFELAYEVLLAMAEKRASRKDMLDIKASLLAAKKWVIALRDVDKIFKAVPGAEIEKTISLPYDVANWYAQGIDSLPLVNYRKETAQRIFYDKERIKRIFQEAQKTFGGDVFFQTSKLLINRDIKDFWRSYKVIF